MIWVYICEFHRRDPLGTYHGCTCRIEHRDVLISLMSYTEDQTAELAPDWLEDGHV